MSDRRTENARTLASLLGVETEEAAKRLDIAVMLRADPTDVAAMGLAEHLRELLSRTLAVVVVNVAPTMTATEVLVGGIEPHRPDVLRVGVWSDAIRIGRSVPADRISPTTHPVLLLIAACYTAGALLRAIFGERLQIPGAASSHDLEIPTSAFVGADATWLHEPFELTNSYLAGAGAIGNGFLWALCRLPVSGDLRIVDPDIVSDGNLNRCVWFTSVDLGLSKAVRLAELAQPSFPCVRLTPERMTLQQFGKGQASDRWLERLIVAVDSRRTRRHLQLEIPREVFDASTTGAVECVFHHHRQPTENACLACIYHETGDELARELHMAETIGVGIDDIKQHFVSDNAAHPIHARYPQIPVEELAGQAYDTLFKALCSEGRLVSAEDRQVLAPFAFVSVLAGALLAVELHRRVLGVSVDDFNYWRISPWASPVVDLQHMRGRIAACEFCGQPSLLRASRALWSL